MYYRLPWRDGRCVQHPGTYSPRHSDSGLLAIPTSWSRVADSNPNWDRLWWFAPSHDFASYYTGHCSTPVALDVRGMMIWRHPHLPPAYYWQYPKSSHLTVSNLGKGLRSLLDLTKHLTTRADDNHAPPVSTVPEGKGLFLNQSLACQV